MEIQSGVSLPSFLRTHRCGCDVGGIVGAMVTTGWVCCSAGVTVHNDSDSLLDDMPSSVCAPSACIVGKSVLPPSPFDVVYPDPKIALHISDAL